MTIINWHRIQDGLPPTGKRVLIRMRAGYGGAGEGEIHIAMLEIGATREEADKKGVYQFADQFGNNLVPYRWRGEGPMAFWGQDVKEWSEL